MSKFEFIADYFRKLQNQLDRLLCSDSEQTIKGYDAETSVSFLRLSKRFELRFEDSFKGTQVVVYENTNSEVCQTLTLFDGAWVDVDIRLAMVSPCAEVISLPEGQLKIYTAQSISHRIPWLDNKGISVEEIARFIELFVLSLSMRPGELSLETFSISQCFAAWKERQQQAGSIPGLWLSDGTNRFFTLKTVETKELLIDSLKAQTLASWRHWTSPEQTENSGQERLSKKIAFLPESSNGQKDLEYGFIAEVGAGAREASFLEDLDALGGIPYKSQELVLAQV